MPASTTLRGSVLAWAMLLGSLLAPSSIAQVPLPLEHQTGHPYEVLNYNYTEYTMELEKRPYWLVIYNQGPTPTEYWVQRNGRTVHHGTACCDGGEEANITEAGTYSIQLNGKGIFAIVRKELMNSPKPTGGLNITASDRLGLAAISGAGAKTDHFCLDAGVPVDVDIYTADDFRLLETHRNVTKVRGVYDTSWMFLVAFVRLSEPTWVNANIALDGCEPSGPSPATAPTPPAPLPAPGWGFGVALAGLLVGALLARRRAG